MTPMIICEEKVWNGAPVPIEQWWHYAHRDHLTHGERRAWAEMIIEARGAEAEVAAWPP